MPPYAEESMCTHSKQPGTNMNVMNTPRRAPPPSDTIMEDNGNGLGQQSIPSNNLGIHGEGNDSSNLNQPRRRASPIDRMRHRGSQQSSSRSVKTKNGRHITNINRINVINNFGTTSDSRNDYLSSFSTPWKKSRNRDMRKSGWCIIRIVLASLVVFWFGAMMTILKSSPSSSSTISQSKGALSLSQLKMNVGLRVRGGSGAPGVVVNPPVLPVVEVKKAETVPVTTEAHSIFELSMFGNKSPSDFQVKLGSHAPSCSKPLDTSSIAFTFVSQLSADRIWMVQYHCERWGPSHFMSIAVFTDQSAKDVKSELVSKGCSNENLTVQTVGKTKYDPTGTEYPVNLLRNMALSAVKTSHVVYADVDFWPSSDLHSYLSTDTVKTRFASDPKLATVIPVFQMYRRCTDYKDCKSQNIPAMPSNKEKLLNLIRKMKASTFDPTNVGGHGSTKYTTWRDQEEGSFVDLPCIKSNRYEPYLAFRYCSDLPPFQEGFTGYGKNKMTWVMQLRRAGYLFSQLGGAFLIHYPHLDSKARQEWNKKPTALESVKTASELEDKAAGNIDWGSFKRARVDALFLDFKEWLGGTVKDESRTPMCVDALNDDVRLWVHPENRRATDEEVSEESEDEESEDEDTDDGEEPDLVETEDGEDETEESKDVEQENDAQGEMSELAVDGEESTEEDADDAETIDGGIAEESEDTEGGGITGVGNELESTE